MDKLPISYDNACIYKIVCKDVNITEKYVGSTTNLIQRRIAHKTACNNENCKQYNQYVYQFIRANGSFDNWDVVLIEQVIDCKDKEHLHKQERYYIESLKAELNKYIPNRTVKEYNQDNKAILAVKMKDYRQDNKEKLAKQQKEYQQNNKAILAVKMKDYRQDNKEKLAKQAKDYRQDNKERISKQRKNYYQDNKEKISKRRKEYYEKNKK
jgi:hypothetical protein